MKKFTLLSALLFCGAVLAQAQEYKVKLPNSPDRKVTIQLDGDVKIEGYDGEEVSIRGNGQEAPPERAKGLKPLYNTAVDNSGIGLAVTPESGGLKIEKASRKTVDYTIRVPRKVAILFEQANWHGASVTINGVEGDLEVRTNNARIELNQVTGPVVVNSTSGEVKVVYASLNQQKPNAISVISGPIDVTLPANAKASLHLQSISGEMYTDFDLGLKNSKDGLSKVGGGHTIAGTANGGGVEMKLNAISGNIYIRKQK